MYLLRLALRPWRLAPVSQLLSALAVGVLLVITGFIAWVHNGMDTVIKRLQAEQVVTIYLAPSVEKQEEAKVVDTIRTSLGAKPSQDVVFVNGDQFLNSLKERYPELGNEVESLAALEAEAVVPRYVSISGIIGEDVLQVIRKLPGVELVESSKDRYGQVVVAFEALKWVARLFIVGLGLSLLTGLVHLSRVNSHFYRDVLGFLRLWGAHRLGTLMPGAVSGLGVGVLGGGIALSGWIFGSAWMASRLRDLAPVLKALPTVPTEIGFLLFGAGALLGLAGGLLASWWATSSGEGRMAGVGGRAWL